MSTNRKTGAWRGVSAVAAVACLFLAACTVEGGPPPESDPPLVPESAKTPQPTGPQAWSRDLDFDSAPAAADQRQLADGLVASDGRADYSGQRLTYESALIDEKPPSEAELALKRAQERAAAAGKPVPPQVTAAPVTAVHAEVLSADGSVAPPRRQSRLPPPPKFPPLPSKTEAAKAPPGQPTETATAAPDAPDAATEQWAQRESRLPPPPKLPPLPAKTEAAAAPAAAGAPEPAVQAAVAPAAPEPAPEAPGASTTEVAAAELMGGRKAAAAAVVTEAWDAPAGTILVQVSAVSDGDKVMQEWQRLRARYPQILKPLRLVVEEAKLGDRGVFYRVQAGAFENHAGAASACDALIGQGQACFVVVR